MDGRTECGGGRLNLPAAALERPRDSLHATRADRQGGPACSRTVRMTLPEVGIDISVVTMSCPAPCGREVGVCGAAWSCAGCGCLPPSFFAAAPSSSLRRVNCHLSQISRLRISVAAAPCWLTARRSGGHPYNADSAAQGPRQSSPRALKTITQSVGVHRTAFPHTICRPDLSMGGTAAHLSP